jgi:pimeloyl-ACP methyl ester carboxylesterase
MLVFTSFVVYLYKYEAEADLQIASFVTESSSHVPVISVRNRSASADAPSAFLVHGAQCNKSLMIQLAKYLALNGVNSYAIDLPGHGASTEVFSKERLHLAAEEALEYLIGREGLRANRTILIGHSLGAEIVGRLATDARNGPYAASVFLGPADVRGFSTHVPKNLLILSAERDYDYITRFSRAIMADATGGSVDRPERWSGDLTRNEARLWHVIPGVGHMGLIFSDDSFREVLRWVELSTGYHPREERQPPIMASALLVTLLILTAILATLLINISRTPRLTLSRTESGSILRLLLILGYGFLGAFPLSYLILQHHFLRLSEGEVIAAFMFSVGLLASALDFAFCRGNHLPHPRRVIYGLPMALFVVVALYLIADIFITSEFFNLSFTWSKPDRVVAALILAVCLFPFFIVCEGVFEEIRQRVGNKTIGHMLAFAGTCLFYGFPAYALILVGFPLARFASALFLSGLFCACLGLFIRKISDNPSSVASFCAMFSAWIIAVSFIRY